MNRFVTERLTRVHWILRLAIGLTAFLAGLDKFFNLLAPWEQYLSPLAVRLLPVSPAVFMRVVGVIEIVVGLAILTRWTREAAYVAAAWLVMIAINLLTTGRYFDIAVRDVVMGLAAFGLAQVTEALAYAQQPATRRGEGEGGKEAVRLTA